MENALSIQPVQVQTNSTGVVGKYSALLISAEVGIGSILHAWHIPGAGHILSLNQGFLLSRATQKTRQPRSAVEISLTGSALKSLSPAGKKLTPMLAIAVQGILFAFGQFLFGVNPVGTVIGILLLSMWAFVQPVLISFVIFGVELVPLSKAILERIQEYVPLKVEHVFGVLLIILILKVLLAVAVSFWSHTQDGDKIESALQKVVDATPLPNPMVAEIPWSHRLALVAKDLTRPWFLTALVMLSFSMLVISSDWEKAVLYFLRSAATGIISFYALRFLPIQRWAMRALKRVNFASRS